MTKNRVLLQCLLASVLMQVVPVARADDSAEHPALPNLEYPETRFYRFSDLETAGAVQITGTQTEAQQLQFFNTKKKVNLGKRSLTSSMGDNKRFHLNSNYIEKLPYWRDGKRFSPDAELGANMQLSLFDGLKVSGRFTSRMSDQDNSNPQIFDAGNINSWMQGYEIGPFGSFDTKRSRNFADTGKHFIKLDATGKQGAFRYGTRYLSRSKGYESLAKKTKKGIEEDKAGHKSWVSWKQGNLKLKTNYSEYWDNIGNDPEKSRNTDRLVSIAPGYTLHEWPYVGVEVSYAQGSRESSMDPAGEQPYSGPLSRISTSFNISANKINLYLGTSLEESSNDLVESENSKTATHSIGGSYYPFDSIYITPDFSFSQEEYLKGTQEYQYTGTYSSLSLTYKSPEHPYSLHLYAGHESYKGNDGYTDTDNINTSLSLDWDLWSNREGKSTLSFDINSYSYTDHIYSDSSSDDLTARVVWRWTGD